jgi:diguanylate cyclase (GGDEF)-like protein
VLLLLAGTWSDHDEALSAFGVAAGIALSYVREHQARGHVEDLLVDAYTMARRLSRLGGVDKVATRIVEQVARAIHADRVALALYRPDDDRLRIVATYGYPRSIVKDERIEPGSWVIGHVFASGRPVLVPDIRQLEGVVPSRREYRTFSFAAVPIFAGTKALGVLTATDKRDGSAFTRQDIIVLRTFCLAGALALMAARSESEVHRLAYAATVDAVTGLFNRPYFDARLHQEVERAKRSETSVSVLIADIDDFKGINDASGHLAGDAVLRAVGNVLRSAVRVFDVCSRYGGDEFAILMPTSDHGSAIACAERIRQRVAVSHLDQHAGAPRVTISIGVSVIEAGDSPMDLVRRADECLYQAKAEGKNRVRSSLGYSKAGYPPLLDRGPDEPS